MRHTDLSAARTILAREGIPVRSIEPFSGGNINQVYRVNDDLVLRLASDPSAGQRLLREAELIAEIDAGVPTRRIVAVGQLAPFTYQLLGYVDGVTLADYWPDAPEREKPELVRRLVTILRRLHARRFSDFGYCCLEGPSHGSWRELMTWGFEEISLRTREHSFTADLGDAVQELMAFFRANAAALDPGSESHLVHRDLVFDNILIRDAGPLTLIDFELAARGPIDVELMTIEFYCHHPELVGRPDRYADFLPLLAYHYPELYAVPDLEARISLYELICHWNGLVHSLSRCGDGRCSEAPHDFPADIVHRSQAIFAGRRT